MSLPREERLKELLQLGADARRKVPPGPGREWKTKKQPRTTGSGSHKRAAEELPDWKAEERELREGWQSEAERRATESEDWKNKLPQLKTEDQKRRPKGEAPSKLPKFVWRKWSAQLEKALQGTELVSVSAKPDYGEYIKALEFGEVLVTYGRVMMIGPGGGGKTSLRHGLMNLPLPRILASTPLANTLNVKQHWASAGGQFWTEVSEDDEIDEIAACIWKVLQSESDPWPGATLLKSPDHSKATRTFHPPTASGTGEEGAGRSASSLSDEMYKQHATRILGMVRCRLDKDCEPKKQEVLVYVWDCGGQRVLLDVLPTFLTSRTMFMLVFNASLDLEKKLLIATVDKQGKATHTEEYHLTASELLQQWMASIHAHLSLRRQDSISCPFPRILLVGTHLDKLASKPVDQAKEKERVLNHLSSQYRGKAYTNLLESPPGYVVDNTTAGKGKREDPSFKEIRESVNEFASKNLPVCTPVTWVFFRKVMQTYRESKSVFHYKEVEAIAKACLIPPEAVPSVLNFYHELGVLLYYAHVELLQMFIIADPQWLINELAKLLLPPSEDHGQQYYWDILQTKGILIEKFYQDIWKDSPVGPKALVNLLEAYMLAAELKVSKMTRYEGKQYFVPLMLCTEIPPSTPTVQPQCEAEPLYLVFDTHYVPPGFYVRLLASLANNPKCRVLFNRIYRYCVTFAYENDIDEIQVQEHNENIEVRVVRPDENDRMLPFSSVCREVLEMLIRSIEDVHQFLPSVAVETAFLCKKCTTTSKHYAVFTPDTLTTSPLRCNAYDALQFPTPEQQHWLTEEQHHLKQEEQHRLEEEEPQEVQGWEGTETESLVFPLSVTSHSYMSQSYAPHQDPSSPQSPLAPAQMDSLAASAGYGSVSLSSRPQPQDDLMGLDYAPENVDLLSDVALRIPNKWREVGLVLGIEKHDLDRIEDQHYHRSQKTFRYYEEVFDLWKRQNSEDRPHTWATLIRALRSPLVDEQNLADDLKRDHMTIPNYVR